MNAARIISSTGVPFIVLCVGQCSCSMAVKTCYRNDSAATRFERLVSGLGRGMLLGIILGSLKRNNPLSNNPLTRFNYYLYI